MIGKTLIGQNFNALREFHWNALFIGIMHFMDKYNYDIERVQRCCIHYATTGRQTDPLLHVQQRPRIPGAGLEEAREGEGRVRGYLF